MILRGKVSGGMVVLDDPKALPDGTEVKVQPVAKRTGKRLSLAAKLRRWAGKCKGLPSDLALNHDHYLHGQPRR
ncbi:MAG: hypothetical protein NTW87_20850 [Planctomycetota bacterium]|nr:hypothetical protein [Planctomycetota bacterium]